MRAAAFLKFSAIAAMLSAFTTLGVHFIDFTASTFEERLLLGRDPWYVFQKQMIIVHCLLVIISMFGAAVVAWTFNRGLAALGALFFAVFGITEITRMFSVLVYLNPLREKYLAATDASIRQILQLQIESFGLASTVMFFVFILAFGLANLFLGLSLLPNRGADRWIAGGLLFWAGLTFLAFGNNFWPSPALGMIIEANNKFFQPVMRLAIGWWLWRKSYIFK